MSWHIFWGLLGSEEQKEANTESQYPQRYCQGKRFVTYINWFDASVVLKLCCYSNYLQGIKGGGHAKPSNIGDLFSEGSLNPYADDPYAFD